MGILPYYEFNPDNFDEEQAAEYADKAYEVYSGAEGVLRQLNAMVETHPELVAIRDQMRLLTIEAHDLHMQMAAPDLDEEDADDESESDESEDADNDDEEQGA